MKQTVRFLLIALKFILMFVAVILLAIETTITFFYYLFEAIISWLYLKIKEYEPTGKTKEI